LLFGATGAVWVSAGILWSAIVVAEQTGAVACLATPAVYAVIVTGTPLGRWPGANIFNVMNGAHLSFLDPATALFTGRFPWQAVAGPVGVAAVLLAASGMVVRRADF